MALGTKNQVIDGCGVHHIAIQTQDYEASKAFYQDVLGFQLVLEWGDARKMCMLDIGDGSHLELFAPGETPVETVPNPTMQHLAFFVKDVDASVARLREAQVNITVEPREVMLGPQKAKIAFFKGPNGETLELMQYL